MRGVTITSILSRFDQKNHFFEGWSWFKVNNLGLALGMALKFYTSVTKGLKLKVRKSWGLTPAFVEVAGGKTDRGAFLPPLILNRVDRHQHFQFHENSIFSSMLNRYQANQNNPIIKA